MYSLNLIISSKLLRLRSITEQKSKRRFSGSLVLWKLTSKYFCMNENGINTSLSASAYKQSMSSFLFGRPIFFLTSWLILQGSFSYSDERDFFCWKKRCFMFYVFIIIFSAKCTTYSWSFWLEVIMDNFFNIVILREPNMSRTND